MKSELQKKLAELIDKSRDSSSYSDIPEVDASTPVEKGGLYVFDLPAEVPVQWCAVFTHPDNDHLWFTAPADEFPLVGTKDVEVPASAEYGPLNIRCTKGIWIHSSEFLGSEKFGKLDQVFVEHVRDRLSRRLDDDLPRVDYLVQTDADPDYTDWMEELSRAVAAFESQLHDLVDEEEQVTELTNALGEAPFYFQVADQELALSADDGQSAPVDYKSSAYKYHEIPYDGPGKIVAVCHDEFLFFHLADHPANQPLPQVVELPDDRVVAWKQRPEWLRSEILVWRNNAVTFSVDGNFFSILK